MTEIQEKSILVRVSARFELARVRVIGSRLYYELMLGTNEILASKHDIAKGQTTTLCDRHIGSSKFFRLLLRLKMSKSITFKYLHDSNTEYSDAAA